MKLQNINVNERAVLMGNSKAYMIEVPYYQILSDKLSEYDGGYFEIVTTENGTPIFYLDSDKKVTVEAAFDPVETDLKTATVAIWVLNVNWASWVFAEKDSELSRHFADMYYDLRSAIYDDDNPLEIDQSALFKILD